MVFPVVPIRQPAVLAGQTNGNLDDRILVETIGQAGGSTVRLVDPAARSWRALTAAALAEGHILKATGPYDSYRPYWVQEQIFRARYTTTYLAGRPYKIWKGRRWYQRPGTAVAAVPGRSNHGLGITVDTGEENDGDPGTESLDDPTLAWLIAHEQTYGFSHEIQSERWHIRYFAGDQIPPAVLAHEHAHDPTSKEDEDMQPQIVWYSKDGKTHAYVLVANQAKHLGPDGLNLLRYLKVHETKTHLDATWQGTAIIVDGPCQNVSK